MNDLTTAYEALRKEARALNHLAAMSGRIKAERLKQDRDVMDRAADIVFMLIEENEGAD